MKNRRFVALAAFLFLACGGDGPARDPGDDVAADADAGAAVADAAPSPDGDPDGDGLDLAAEEAAGTDPFDADTDRDGLDDGDELDRGTSPVDPDSDADGLDDGAEVAAGANPLDPDSDGDTLSDGDEVARYGSDPTSADTDADGISDAAEVFDTGTDPSDADTDGDGLLDPDEITEWGSDPTRADGDGDGLDDAFEVRAGLHPLVADTDRDGLTDREELEVFGTDPAVADTDGDGLSDGEEVVGGTSPLFGDSDLDGLADGQEAAHGADPSNPDTDDDGLPDGAEVSAGTWPDTADTDGDGLSDGDEVDVGAAPLEPDTDGDGLVDGEEVAVGANPLVRDSDEDGVADLDEARVFGTSPSNADTDADGIGDGDEIKAGLDPLAQDADADPDGDGLTSAEELARGTEPNDPDTDRDGLNDGAEVTAAADPLDADSDDDGVLDGTEVRLGADPLDADSDDDGIDDGEEPAGVTDVDGDGLAGIVDADSDGDGWLDADELRVDEDTDGDGFVTLIDPDSDDDGLLDGVEVAWGLDPFDPADALEDRDMDGLTNFEEVRHGTDLDDGDSDGDGLGDAAEVVGGLDPTNGDDAARDADNDGLSNADEVLVHSTDPRDPDSDDDGTGDGREVALGSGPLDTDSDDDGVPDGDEREPVSDRDGDGRIGLLDPDSDGDGLTDYEEWVLGLSDDDSDGDGVSDQEETAAGTDPASRDTDADGLNDAQELLGCAIGDGRVPTNPARADTDDDGLPDPIECGLGTDPTGRDSDGDGLLDGDELRRCTAADVTCTVGAWIAVTDPLDADSDDDGVPDGFDPAPSDPDFDGDGLSDGDEAVFGYDLAGVEFAVTDGADLVPEETVIAFPLGLEALYHVVVDFGPTDAAAAGEVRTDAPPELVVRIDGEATTVPARWEGRRFFASAPRAVDASEVTLAFEGEGVQVHRVYVMGVPDTVDGFATAGVRTFADDPDTDGDGIDDGAEAAGGAVWLDAEHSRSPQAPLRADARAGNGALVDAEPGFPVFRYAVDGARFESGQRWAVFVRSVALPGAATQTVPVVTVDVRGPACASAGADPICGGGTCACDGDACACEGARQVLNFENDATLRWRWVGSFESLGGDVRIHGTEAGPLATPAWAVDRVAVLPIDFAPSEIVRSYDQLSPTLSALLRVPGVDTATPLPFAVRVPAGFSDPMEADTDGDGMRSADGAVSGSVGWLTDGVERTVVGTNAFSIDTDGDGAFGTVADALADGASGFVWDGNTLTLTGAPDGRPDFGDAADPAPRTIDADNDGLLDAVEIREQLARLRQACADAQVDAGDAACASLATCGACPETAFDDRSDLIGTCVDTLLPGANALPLCDFADDDRDDDGLLDGTEDASRNGRFDAGETDPNLADTDGDCIPDGVELGLTCPEGAQTLTNAPLACGRAFLTPEEGGRAGDGFVPDADPSGPTTSPRLLDSDGDGVRDGAIVVGPIPSGEDLNCDGAWTPADGETNPARADTDGDRVDDGAERLEGTDPLLRDSDGDGLGDGEELYVYGTEPNLADSDGDGLDDGDEARPSAGPATDPAEADTDGDGIDDGDEVNGTGPLGTCAFVEQCGTSGSCDTAAECRFGATDPTLVDTDGDGIDDGDEVLRADGDLRLRTNPARADTDGDGIDDGDELAGTGPLTGIGPTDPHDPDSDGDGFVDGAELERGHDPTDPGDAPEVVSSGLDGVDFPVSDLQRDGDVLFAEGRVPLSCPDRPAVAFLDGRVELEVTDGRYRMRGDGDLIVRGEDGEDLVVWTGETLFSEDATFATAGAVSTRLSTLELAGGAIAVSFDPPACVSDADCVDAVCAGGFCEGALGVDRVDLCGGQLVDDQADITLDDPSAGEGAATRFTGGGVALAPSLSELSTSYLRQRTDIDPAQFPWEGRSCTRSPEVVRIHADMIGDLRFSPNPDFDFEGPGTPGVPRFEVGGSANLGLPGLSDIPVMNPFADVAFRPDVGGFTFTSPIDFQSRFVDLDGLGGLAELLVADIARSQGCLWDWDAGKFSCPVRYEKRSSPGAGQAAVKQWEFNGTIGVSTHGLIPFQTDASHTFDGLACGDGVDLCQDGHLEVDGVLEVPLKYGLVALLDGLFVADVTTRDDDPLFAGAFGTLSFSQRLLRSVGESGLVDFPFPLSLEVANATSALVFEDDRGQVLDRIVFFAQNGFTVVGSVDIAALPTEVLQMFDPNRAQARGCVDISSGVMDAETTLWPFGFEMRMGLTVTPPFRGTTPDLSAGSIEGRGRFALTAPFGPDVGFDVSGRLEYDGGFRFTGLSDDEVALPGLGGLGIPNAAVTVANEGVRLAGEMPLPGLGDASASGLITARGGFDLALSGELAPLGFTLSNVTGRAQSGRAVTVSGAIALPGGLSTVGVSGTFRSPLDWRLESTVGVDVPFTGLTLFDTRLTMTPAGATLAGRIDLPGWSSVRVSGAIQSNGAMVLSGVVDVGVGPLRFAGGRMTVTRSVGGAFTISVDANLSIAGFGAGRVAIDVGTDGAFEASGTISFAGQRVPMTVYRRSDGTVGGSGSVSVSGSAGGYSLSGSITVTLDGTRLGGVFRGGGFELGVDSNGCVRFGVPRDCGPAAFVCNALTVTVCLS